MLGIKFIFLLLLVKLFTTKIDLQPIEQGKLTEKKAIPFLQLPGIRLIEIKVT